MHGAVNHSLPPLQFYSISKFLFSILTFVEILQTLNMCLAGETLLFISIILLIIELIIQLCGGYFSNSLIKCLIPNEKNSLNDDSGNKIYLFFF